MSIITRYEDEQLDPMLLAELEVDLVEYERMLALLPETGTKQVLHKAAQTAGNLVEVVDTGRALIKEKAGKAIQTAVDNKGRVGLAAAAFTVGSAILSSEAGAASTAGTTAVTVAKGNTEWSISAGIAATSGQNTTAVLGKVQALNPNVNPTLMPVGSQLIVPVEGNAAAVPAATATAENATSGTTTVIIKSGDTEWTIANQIAEANGQSTTAVLAKEEALNTNLNPRLLPVGGTLVEPVYGNTAAIAVSAAAPENAANDTTVSLASGQTISLYAQPMAVQEGVSLNAAVVQIEKASNIPANAANRLPVGQPLEVSASAATAVAAQEQHRIEVVTPVASPVGEASVQTSANSVNDTMYWVGDSLTVGMEGTNLSADLTAQGYTVNKFEATVGDGISEAIPKVVADSSEVAAAGTVVVELGTNECELSGIPACDSTAEVEAQIQAMDAAIHKENPTAHVDWIDTYSTKTTANASVNQAIADEAAPLGYTDIGWSAKATADPAGLSFDPAMGVHQTTTAGYQTMSADVVGLLPHAPTPPPPAPVPVAAPVAAPAPAASSFIEEPNTTDDGTMSIAENEATLITSLEAKGESAGGAEGVAGDVADESGFQTDRLQNTPSGEVTPFSSLSAAQLNDPVLADGEFQFDPPKKLDVIVAGGLNPNNLENQINLMYSEAPPALIQALDNPAISPSSAALLFDEQFEKPTVLGANAIDRENNAIAIAKQVADGTIKVPTPAVPVAAPVPAPTSTTIPAAVTPTAPTTTVVAPAPIKPIPTRHSEPEVSSTTTTTTTPQATTTVPALSPQKSSPTKQTGSTSPGATTTTAVASPTTVPAPVKVTPLAHPTDPTSSSTTTTPVKTSPVQHPEPAASTTTTIPATPPTATQPTTTGTLLLPDGESVAISTHAGMPLQPLTPEKSPASDTTHK